MSRLEITKMRAERVDANAALEAKIREMQSVLEAPGMPPGKKVLILAKIESVRARIKAASAVRDAQEGHAQKA